MKLHVQALHQEVVTNLEAQITAAHAAAADKQAVIGDLKSAIAELKNKSAELQDQNTGMETTVGKQILCLNLQNQVYAWITACLV